MSRKHKKWASGWEKGVERGEEREDEGVKQGQKRGEGRQACGCVFTPFLLTFALCLIIFFSFSLSLCWTCNNCCCLQAGSQMSQTRVLFSDFAGCFSSSAFHYFSSLVQVQLFGCIVIMFAIKLMKSFALLPINLCFPLSPTLFRTVSTKSLLPNCAVHAKK